MASDPTTDILSPNQAAKVLMVSPATVRQWASKGKLNALTTPGGHRRFRMSDIQNFAQQKNITLNIESEDPISKYPILIVDDDTQFSSYLAELIPIFDDRIQVKVANDGFEAGKLVHSFKPVMILMDLMMPTMDGFETCKSIKSDPATANIRIICMTGYGSSENIERIKALGAEDCLTKPIDETQLERVVQNIFSE